MSYLMLKDMCFSQSFSFMCRSNFPACGDGHHTCAWCQQRLTECWIPRIGVRNHW